VAGAQRSDLVPEVADAGADENHAPGALTYQIAYGDGATDQNTAQTV